MDVLAGSSLGAALKQALAMPDVQDALSKQGFATMNMGPNEFGKFYASETAKWAKLVEELGLAH